MIYKIINMFSTCENLVPPPLPIENTIDSPDLDGGGCNMFGQKEKLDRSTLQERFLRENGCCMDYD